jgi:hypothetical protein
MKTHEQIEALEDHIRKDTISDERSCVRCTPCCFAFDDTDYRAATRHSR